MKLNVALKGGRERGEGGERGRGDRGAEVKRESEREEGGEQRRREIDKG